MSVGLQILGKPDSEPRMFQLAQAFLSILLVVFCGLVAAPMWSVLVAAIALASLSYARHFVLFRRAADLGMQDEIDRTLLGSLVNALAASAVAYSCGMVLRVLSVGWQ
jgi:hypothetical protein